MAPSPCAGAAASSAGSGWALAARERGSQSSTHGALLGLAADAHGAARLDDRAVHHRQAEAGSLADLLGGEEGLDGAGQRRLIHAFAGVGYGRHDVIAGREVALCLAAAASISPARRRSSRHAAWHRAH